MKKRILILPVFLLTLLVGGCKNGAQNTTEKTNKTANTSTPQRIISLNGAITTIIAQLGHSSQLVGRDVTSTYPETVKKSVKNLGHVRSLSIESMMNLNPDLILASSKDMNDKLKISLEKSRVKFQLFDQEYSVKGTKTLINEVADFIESNRVQPIIDQIDQDLKEVQPFDQQPDVLFVYARGAGTLMVAGKDTPMAKMIDLAGGKNVISDFSNFKPFTEEALVEHNPDVILLFNSGLQSLGGREGFLKAIPALSQTTAGKNKAIISMDGGLLSDFGPRLGQAAVHLNKLLKPYAN